MTELNWVPETCTLPTAEQPPRAAEWDALFAGSITAIERPQPLLLRLSLGTDTDIAALRDLAAQESDCCSFFTFTVAADPDGAGGAVLDIEVGAAHESVLNALQERASSIVSPG